MSFYSLYVVIPRKPSVAVHNERNMLRNWPLFQGADKYLSQLSYCPCDWRRGCKPLVYTRVVNGTHGGIDEVLGLGNLYGRNGRDSDGDRLDCLVRGVVYDGNG